MKLRYFLLRPLNLVAAIVLGLSLCVPFGTAIGQAQFPGPKKGPGKNAPKNLTGQVVDKEGKGLAEAVLYLKNKRTREVKTHISDDKGAYNFDGLDPNTDYEVHAELKGASSPTQSVSSFDDRKEIYLKLEIGASQ